MASVRQALRTHRDQQADQSSEEQFPDLHRAALSNTALRSVIAGGDLAHPGLARLLAPAAGNSAIQRLVQPMPAAALGALEVSSPHDRSEQEAELIARQVVAMPEGEMSAQRRPARGGVGAAQLPSGVRDYFEPRLGTDLSAVTVHTGAEADQLSRQLDARAFTTGNDVYFRDGEYQPDSGAGRELLAHELVHVAQQSPGLHRAPAETATAEAVDAVALRSDFLRDRDIFLNLWLAAALAALEGAPEAKDEESTANFWVALAGNLLWAASSLVAPEALLIIRLMSFAGAAVGSGALAQNPEQPPSGKEIASEMLTKSRDLMVQSSGASIDAAIADCRATRTTDADQQRQVLWGKLFNTPYNQSEPIRKEMKAKIEAGMADFLKQWHNWKDEIREEAEEKGYSGGLPPDVYGDPSLVAKYEKDPEKAWRLVQDPVSRVGALERYLRSKRPFQAEMKFR
ncbi:DUF4157 domain-containing protein [Actinoplanes sp. NPDC026619]|uniref:eCIS core domain-containing protein n=1 Tax=Actinoplanes sp. NPDC026619 TaxID=3155798 RepID=UPI0033E5A35C